MIVGWDKGLQGLCAGAKASLIVPADMAYGDNGDEIIPAGAVLRFDIEVLKVRPPDPENNIFKDIDANHNHELTKDEIDAYFDNQGKRAPAGLWDVEDKDADGKITWEEFGGPKGRLHPKVREEL